MKNNRRPSKIYHSVPGRLFAFSALLVFLLAPALHALTKTLDADGGADYTSWNTLIDDIQSDAINPDTILILSGDQDTYPWTSNITVDPGLGNLYIIGEETDPDAFPILNHTATDWANAIATTNFYWERLILTGSFQLLNNDAATTISFKKCVIRDYSNAFLNFNGASTSTAIFENCLFEGNTAAVIGINVWGAGPVMKITNCTFDNNTAIYDQDEDLISGWSFRNNIFVGNTTTFPGNNLRGITTYSHTDEACTNYGTGCVSDADPEFSTGTRNNPTDWDLANPSSARNIGTKTGAPNFDLEGGIRTGFPDAGAFEGALDTVPTLVLPDSAGEDDETISVSFNIPKGPENASIKLTFSENGTSLDANDPHVLTLSGDVATTGSHTFTLNGFDLSDNDTVSSVNTGANDFLADDAVYNVIIQYDTNSVTYADTNLNWTYNSGGGGGPSLPFNDDFETDLSLWTASAGVTRPAEDARSGTYCAKLTGTDENITSDPIDLSGYHSATDIDLRFYYRDDGTVGVDDCFYLDVYDGTWHNDIYSKCDDQNAYTLVDIDIDSLHSANDYKYASDYKVRIRIGGTLSRVWVADDLTFTATFAWDPPTLISPAANSTDSNKISVSFNLPYTADNGSLKLTFDEEAGGANDPNDPHIITLSNTLAGKGVHNFIIDGLNLTSSGNVTSVSSGQNLIHGTVYDVWIEMDTNSNNVRDTNLNFDYKIPPAPDNYSTWTYSYALRLNTTATGANVSGAVTNFPLLVRIFAANKPTANFFSSETQADGGDLRFSKTTDITCHFPYEIEYWNNSDTAIIWVLLDSVPSNSQESYVTMHWGNGSAGDSSNGEWVFGIANSFAGVWHLNENPNGDPSDGIKDRTSNDNDGTPGGTMTTADQVTGAVDRAIDFEGTDDGITISDHSTLDITSAVTVSCWFNATALTAWSRLGVKAHTSDAAPYTIYGLVLDDASHIRGEMADISSTQYIVNGSTALSTGTWYHAVFTYDGSTMRTYLNGAAESNTTSQTNGISSNSQDFTIAKAGFNNNYFSGKIDEMRVSNTARSANWIRLCYQNQKSSDALVSFPGYTPTLTTPATSGSDDQDFDVQFTIPQTPNAGTVKMTFTENGTTADANDPHVITFNSNVEGIGTYSFQLDGLNLDNHANVASADKNPNDFLGDGATYNVKIEYQKGGTTYDATNTSISYSITSGPTATLPFFESFEATPFTNWVTSGTVSRVATHPKDGTYNAFLDNPSSSMYTTLNLSPYVGATDVLLSWWWMDDGAAFESTDSLLVDIDHDGDGNWNTSVYKESGAPTSLTRRTLDLDAQTATLPFTSTYRFRFRIVTNGVTEEANIDSVFVNGTRPLTSPTLNTPAANASKAGDFTVNFYLPYTGDNGSIKLTFDEISTDSDDPSDPHVLTLHNNLAAKGVHSFTLQGDDLLGSDSVTAVSSGANLVQGCTYDVWIQMDTASQTKADTNLNFTWGGIKLVWARSGLGTLAGGAINDSALYVGSGGSVDSLFKINIYTGATIWSYYTGATGDCGAPTYWWNAGTDKFDILFTVGNYIYGRRDNGTSSAEIFSPVNVGSAPGRPYPSPNNNSFFYPYTNTMGHKSQSSGANMPGFPKTLTGISTSADVIVANDEIIFSKNNDVCKMDFDGTDLACADVSATVSLPLLMADSVLYVTPDDDSLQAIMVSTMNRKWDDAVALTAANTGPAFSDDTINVEVYVSAGNKVQRVTDNGATGSVTWTSPDLGDQIRSGPLIHGNYIYAGRDGGRYYVLKNSDGTVQTGWPYFGPASTSDASMGPWINEDSTRVIFGSTGGNLDAFPLE